MSKKTPYSTSNYHNEHVMRWHWQKIKERHLARQGQINKHSAASVALYSNQQHSSRQEDWQCHDFQQQ